MIRTALITFWPNAEIAVESDLLGAARACHGEHSGFAGILGTGSNSCMYDGKVIVETVPPLGYMLGDEGSATSIGKALIRSWLRGKLSNELSEKITSFCGLQKDEILDRVYRQPQPRQFLSGLAKFAFDHKETGEVEAVIHDCFTGYFRAFVGPYRLEAGYKLKFVGSIAFHFRNELFRVTQEQGFRLEDVILSPADELVKYHQYK